MVKICLEINANLDNIDEIKTDHPNYTFFIKIKCTNCGEISDKWHSICENEKIDDSRNPKGFNFFMKCKLCSRENTIDIIEGSNSKYTTDDSGSFKSIVHFDCRGAEPVEFSPRDGWIIKSIDNGQTFNDVDLSEDDWVEYDQKNKNSIGIYEFQSRFIKLKK